MDIDELIIEELGVDSYRKGLNFNRYDVSKGTDKEDELFDSTEIPSYYKEYNKTYKIDDNKYNLMTAISKQIYDNKDSKRQYEKMLDNLEKKIFTKIERNLCLKPIFNYSKSAFESVLRKLSRKAEKEAEEFYNMDKNRYDFDIGL